MLIEFNFEMSFSDNELIVHNIFGQRVVVKINLKPNCYGFVDLVDDEVGDYCMKHSYLEALQLHSHVYSQRYLDKTKKWEEWNRNHSAGQCKICTEKRKVFEELRLEPDFQLAHVFGEGADVHAVLRSHRLPLLPPPDTFNPVCRLPSDEEVMKELRKELFTLNVNLRFTESRLTDKIMVLTERLRRERVSLNWHMDQWYMAAGLLKKYRQLVELIPSQFVEQARCEIEK